jgi:hypothetical protein
MKTRGMPDQVGSSDNYLAQASTHTPAILTQVFAVFFRPTKYRNLKRI